MPAPIFAEQEGRSLISWLDREIQNIHLAVSATGWELQWNVPAATMMFSDPNTLTRVNLSWCSSSVGTIQGVAE